MHYPTVALGSSARVYGRTRFSQGVPSLPQVAFERKHLCRLQQRKPTVGLDPVGERWSGKSGTGDFGTGHCFPCSRPPALR